MALDRDKNISLKAWFRSGDPLIWVNAAAVSISVVAVLGLLFLLAIKGFGHFWPADILQADYLPGKDGRRTIIGELVETESVPIEQIRSSGIELNTDEVFISRSLIKLGNKDVTGTDFTWVIDSQLENQQFPLELMAIERREWGNFYGYLKALKQQGVMLGTTDDDDAKTWKAFQQSISRVEKLAKKIRHIEKVDIGAINYDMERLRLQERGLSLDASLGDTERLARSSDIAMEKTVLDQQYELLQEQLIELYQQINRDSFTAVTMDGREIELPVAKVVRAYRPNAMDIPDKMVAYVEKFWEFISDEPREANTEGGIFPAIFGTVMMVMLMSVMVTPFGVVAAVYLREYAKQGLMTRIIRIAVNNLAGVPSIVYGVFGLGFFIYFLGSEIDQVFFQNALPAPTFGTPGLLWASLTLALLTLPVVIVATEEGLARIPSALREGSLALGATKAETLWRIVLPMASPAMMTGLILAVARAAGEVAPLMLVGVVKLAPSLPVDGNYPYMHLDQKFMHLGFHIFDVGFQSPNIEAARPLVYATAFLLVVIIALLNFSAVALRNRLRERYKSLEM